MSKIGLDAQKAVIACRRIIPTVTVEVLNRLRERGRIGYNRQIDMASAVLQRRKNLFLLHFSQKANYNNCLQRDLLYKS